MTEEERQSMNDSIHKGFNTRLSELEERMDNLESRMAEKDTQFAVINTKLSAILWGVGVICTALVGVLVKLIF